MSADHGPGSIHGEWRDDPTVVAALTMPLPVRNLQALNDTLRGLYGPGLMMGQHGRFLVVYRPAEDSP